MTWADIARTVFAARGQDPAAVTERDHRRVRRGQGPGAAARSTACSAWTRSSRPGFGPPRHRLSCPPIWPRLPDPAPRRRLGSGRSEIRRPRTRDRTKKAEMINITAGAGDADEPGPPAPDVDHLAQHGGTGGHAGRQARRGPAERLGQPARWDGRLGDRDRRDQRRRDRDPAQHQQQPATTTGLLDEEQRQQRERQADRADPEPLGRGCLPGDGSGDQRRTAASRRPRPSGSPRCTSGRPRPWRTRRRRPPCRRTPCPVRRRRWPRGAGRAPADRGDPTALPGAGVDRRLGAPLCGQGDGARPVRWPRWSRCRAAGMQRGGQEGDQHRTDDEHHLVEHRLERERRVQQR